MSLLFSLPSMILTISAVSKISPSKLINRFAHEGLRELLRAFTYENSGIMPLVFTMGALSRGDGGFPAGGSLPFAERIVKTFTGLGGEILYRTRADRVIVENGRATAVMADDKKLPADAVIITADTMAIDYLFDTPPTAKWFDEMRAVTEPTMAVFVSLGIKADLRKYHYYYAFRLKTPIKLDTETYEFINVSNYASDPDYSPDGKTAMTIQLPGDTYDFWKKVKEENRYAEEKQKIADKVIEILSEKVPQIRGKVAVVDVATPLTYERYCGSYHGGWMTKVGKSEKMQMFPTKSESVQGLYFAGHRIQPPGGLPVAAETGRIAAQHLCKDNDMVFQGKV